MSGRSIAAFAISEANAGSDLSAMTTTARRDGLEIVITGEKTWISNAGIAGFYVVFCRWPEGGDKSFIALIVEADAPGFRVSGTIEVMAPHPLGTLVFDECRVPAASIIGEPGKGMRVALGTLDVFRTTVGAAAVGFARRALSEALGHVKGRSAFGQPLADFQLTQARLADMATAIDAAALLVYRAAWTRDQGAERITREAAMAKLVATESAQRVIDDARAAAGSPRRRARRSRRAALSAKSAPCASTKARARFKNSSSPASSSVTDGMRSAHVDRFVLDRLPAPGLRPHVEWHGLAEPPYPAQLNCASDLLDRWAREAPDRIALHHAGGAWSYGQLFAAANRIAHVLSEDFGLEPRSSRTPATRPTSRCSWPAGLP